MNLPQSPSDQYITLRNELAFESVSFGSTTVNLFRTDELKEAQVGYSVGEHGESFTGEEEGDWRQQWFVIGYEDLCGDPIFVDLSNSELPVFTAAHGEGPWLPELIASSFNGFIKALEEVNAVSEGRQTPVELERNPLSASQREHALKKIAEANPHASLEFWAVWLGNFVDK